MDVRPLPDARSAPDTGLLMPPHDPASQTVDNLILDLLEWIGPGERPYLETMEAWRTSCPRLPVWEDATDRGFIERHHRPGAPAFVTVSASGVDHLHAHREISAD